MPFDRPMEQVTALLEGRLHPATLLLGMQSAFRNIAFAIGIAVASRKWTFFASTLVFFAFLQAVATLFRYFSFRYRLSETELVLISGVFNRQERQIALERIQDVRIEQSLLSRVFKVAEIQIETAGGSGAEASFAYLGLNEADALRAALSSQRLAIPGVGSENQDVPVPEEVELWRVPVTDLIRAGLTSNHAAQAVTVIAGILSMAEDFLPRRAIYRWAENRFFWLAEQSAHAGWSPPMVALAVALLLLMLLAIGLAASVLGTILLYHNFRLTLRGENLHHTYGLLTRRAGSVARKRLQRITVEQTLLRRLVRLVTIKSDSAASRARAEERHGRDVLVPALPVENANALLPVLLPDLDGENLPYQPVARVAIRRNAMPSVFLCLIITGTLFVVRGFTQQTWDWLPGLVLVFVPLAFLLSRMNYQFLGYRLGERTLWLRSGWLDRMTSIIPIRNTQMIVVRQTIFDRRARVATLHVDLAGVKTPTMLGNLPAETALETARHLARHGDRLRRVSRPAPLPEETIDLPPPLESLDILDQTS